MQNFPKTAKLMCFHLKHGCVNGVKVSPECLKGVLQWKLCFFRPKANSCSVASCHCQTSLYDFEVQQFYLPVTVTAAATDTHPYTFPLYNSLLCWEVYLMHAAQEPVYTGYALSPQWTGWNILTLSSAGWSLPGIHSVWFVKHCLQLHLPFTFK